MGPLNHSPADVLRRLLIDLGVVADPEAPGEFTEEFSYEFAVPGSAEPGANAPWAAYVAGEPNSPEQVLTLYDTAGRDFGRTRPDNERQEFHGVQLRVRAGTHRAGYLKARAMALVLDGVSDASVTLDADTYRVQTVVRTGDVIPLGKDVPAGRRSLFTVNALATLWKV